MLARCYSLEQANEDANSTATSDAIQGNEPGYV